MNNTVTININNASEKMMNMISDFIEHLHNVDVTINVYECPEHDTAKVTIKSDDIIYNSLGDANEVLHEMMDITDRYGYVTIADMLELSGKPCSYTDNRYGWADLRGASIISTRDGYVIDFPKPLPIA